MRVRPRERERLCRRSERGGAVPLRPIGRFRSSFSCRNGTPRQPQLVPLARGRLTLRRHVPPAALEGLEAFSHAWIIYVFHENTDLHNAVGAGDEMRGQTRGGQSRTTSRAKVRVPRLNGERRGVFATRTPHRPLPVGLSLVEVYAVDSERGVLDVGGADLGRDARAGREAVLAVLRGAGAAGPRAPDWVDFATDRFEPLTIESVEWAPGARERLSGVWERRGESKSLYASSAEFCAFARRRFRLTSDRRTGEYSNVDGPSVPRRTGVRGDRGERVGGVFTEFRDGPGEVGGGAGRRVRPVRRARRSGFSCERSVDRGRTRS